MYGIGSPRGGTLHMMAILSLTIILLEHFTSFYDTLFVEIDQHNQSGVINETVIVYFIFCCLFSVFLENISAVRASPH